MSQVFFFLILVVLQNNQTSVQFTDKPPEKPECQIVGTVVRQEGGQPIKSSRVFLRPEGPGNDLKHYGLKTGDDGRFCFSDVRPARYRLGAERNGYVTQMYGADEAWSQGAVLTVAKDQKLEPILLRLVSAGVISGKVVDADGELAMGILVQALLPPASLESILGDQNQGAEGIPKSGLLPVRIAVTNDLGEYRLAGLPPEEYFVSAVDTGAKRSDSNFLGLPGDMFMEANDDENTDKYAPTFHPAATRPEQAERVFLEAGMDVKADIQLQHEKMVTVSGLVVHPDGKPGSKTVVSLSDGDPLSMMFSRPMAQTDDTGHFSIKSVLPGSYSVVATCFEHEDMAQGLNARQKVEVGQRDVASLRLVLSQGLSVAGKVSVEGGPLPKLTDSFISFATSEDESLGGNGNINKDGSFTVTGLEPATYSVGFTFLPEPYYLKRLTYNGRSSSDHMVTIEPGVPAGRVEIVVSSHAAAITGTAENSDHAPLSGVSVVLRSGSNKAKNLATPNPATTDQDGKFFFRGLAPGTYTVTAKKRGKPGVPADTGEITVKVAEDEQKAITLTLENKETR